MPPEVAKAIVGYTDVPDDIHDELVIVELPIL